jgi:hypothetical protein
MIRLVLILTVMVLSGVAAMSLVAFVAVVMGDES